MDGDWGIIFAGAAEMPDGIELCNLLHKEQMIN
jgi:hypothetical protein